MAEPAGSRVLVARRVPAPPARAFAVFTERIGVWWRPNPLFTFVRGRTGRLAFEPGAEGRLLEHFDDGTSFEIGRVRCWDPPRELVVSWRQDGFSADQDTELHVRFFDVGEGATRVVVEHYGWDTIPAGHAARHGFPLAVFQRRFAEWWQVLLEELAATTGSCR